MTEVKETQIPHSDSIEELTEQLSKRKDEVEAASKTLADRFGRQVGPGDRLSIKLDALISMILDDKNRLNLDILAESMLLAILTSILSELDKAADSESTDG